MRLAMEYQRQLQHMVEKIGQHRLAAAMCETVGIERDGYAHHDGEEAEADPGGDQLAQVGPSGRRAPLVWAPVSASMIRPNRYGSANMAPAARSWPRRDRCRASFRGRAGRAPGHRDAKGSCVFEFKWRAFAQHMAIRRPATSSPRPHDVLAQLVDHSLELRGEGHFEVAGPRELDLAFGDDAAGARTTSRTRGRPGRPPRAGRGSPGSR